MCGCELCGYRLHSLQQHHWYHFRYLRTASCGSYSSLGCQHDIHSAADNDCHDDDDDDDHNASPWIGDERVDAISLHEWCPWIFTDDTNCLDD